MNSSNTTPTVAWSWLEGELASRRLMVDAALERWLPSEQEQPVPLHQALRYAVLGGGKRLRPILLLAAAEACGGDAGRALPAAAAVELVHCYSLVHDDLPAMDNDDLRRGRPSCHKVFGDALAILTGDALLTLAFELLATEVEPRALAADLAGELAGRAGHAGMVGGQVMDILGEGKEASREQVDYIHRHKTGSLFVAAARMGGLCAGATEEQLAALTNYGERVGFAFQIADDILDVTSTPDDLGKSTRKDLPRGKLTYPGLVGMDEARRAAGQLVEDAVKELKVFGGRARLLAELARFVVSRTQ